MKIRNRNKQNHKAGVFGIAKEKDQHKKAKEVKRKKGREGGRETDRETEREGGREKDRGSKNVGV